jgi:hypothetical protein
MKKFIAILAILTFALLLYACGPSMEPDESKDTPAMSAFVLLEDNSTNGFKVVYHRETKVMYAISAGYYNVGTFTVLLNPDGTPMTYEGN